MVVKMMPLLVSSVVSHSGAAADASIPVICVEQPERYEPLVASCDKNNRSSPPVAISSYDRWLAEGFTLREKHTFLCYEGAQSGKDLRSTRSAPPSICPGRRPVSSKRFSGLGIFAPTIAKVPSDWGDGTISDAIASSVTEALSQAFSGPISSISSSDDTELNVKIGTDLDGNPDSQGFRLSDLYKLRCSGLTSIGTAHRPDECMPCHFFHSPKTCRASFMCEYCHDREHFGKLTRKMRKLRPGNRT